MLLASTNTYSGATTVQRGTTLRFQRGGTGGSSFGTTSGIGVYGTITAESSGSNHGTFFNSAGAVIPVTLYGGSKIYFDNAAITTANAQVDRWDDNTPMAWNQLDLEMKSRDVAAADVTTETVGDVTFTGGNILRLSRGDTNAGNVTRFVVESLTRVNGGTIEITRSSALGGADQFVVTNDAPSPWLRHDDALDRQPLRQEPRHLLGPQWVRQRRLQSQRPRWTTRLPGTDSGQYGCEDADH